MSVFEPSERSGLDGWALMVKGAAVPLPSTLCTTRREARLEREVWRVRGLLHGVTVLVVPVRVHLQVATARSKRSKRGNTSARLTLSRDIG